MKICSLILISILAVSATAATPEPASLRTARDTYASETRKAEIAYHKALGVAKNKLLAELTASLKQLKDPDHIVAIGAEIKQLKESIAMDDAVANGKALPFEIKASLPWQPTINVTKGQTVAVRATGKWSGDPKRPVHGPEGNPSGGHYLQGRIGKGEPFKVGKFVQFVAAEDGELSFEIKDANQADNPGSVQVEIIVK
jgi:hypothetical protein